MRTAHVHLPGRKDVAEAAQAKLQPITFPTRLPDSQNTLRRRADGCGQHELPAAPPSSPAVVLPEIHSPGTEPTASPAAALP